MKTMIDAKQAVQIAKQKAAEVLDQPPLSLEEIERESYKGHDVWSITLSFPPRSLTLSELVRLAGTDRVLYRRLLIDSETGELVAIKLREVAYP